MSRPVNAIERLRAITGTVEECDEHIARAQVVLDFPSEYHVETRVQADKDIRRYTRLRDGADALAAVDALYQAAKDVADYDPFSKNASTEWGDRRRALAAAVRRIEGTP